MPSTLVHIAVQAPATRTFVRGVDFKWILLGCLIPDLPWIIYRALLPLPEGLPLLHLLANAFVQASLLYCLILAAALALLSRWPGRTFVTLAAGALMHLLIDMVEDKIGNGVNLVAPFDWTPLSLRLVGPDATVAIAASLLALAYVVYALVRVAPVPPPDRLPPYARLGLAACLAAVWLVTPPLLARGPLEADVVSLGTLIDRDARPGRDVGFDRRPIVRENGEVWIKAPDLEPIRIANADLGDIELASARGRFIDPGTIELLELRPHTRGLRDGLSYVGLLVVAFWWGRDGWRFVSRHRAGVRR